MQIRWASEIKLKIDNKDLEKVKKAKYLGLMLDERLTLKEHSNELQVKL